MLRCWKPEDGGEKWFCGRCGSSIFARNDKHPEWIGVRMGTYLDVLEHHDELAIGGYRVHASCSSGYGRACNRGRCSVISNPPWA